MRASNSRGKRIHRVPDSFPVPVSSPVSSSSWSPLAFLLVVFCLVGFLFEVRQLSAAPPLDKDLLLGTWCLDGLSETLDGERVVDGSIWKFLRDGAFEFQGGLEQKSTYSLTEDRLTIEDIGDFSVTKLEASNMVLHRYTYHHFRRERSSGGHSSEGHSSGDHSSRDHCGEAVDRAQQVTILVNGALLGDLEVVGRQIKAGVDINAPDLRTSRESTALHAAAERGHREVVEYLLEHGADPSVENFLEQTPIDLARKKGRKEILALLESHLE